MSRVEILGLVLLVCAGCACPSLLDERQASPYAGLLEQTSGLSRAVERFTVSEGGGPPVRVAIEHVRARSGPSERVLVLVPGVFASRGTWRFLVGPLAQRYDLLLIDPPGCGASDAPDPRLVGPTGYTPEWLARHEMLGIGAWLDARGDSRPLTLIGHSLGAATCLRMVSDPDLAGIANGLPGRVDSLVLLGSPDVFVRDVPPTLGSVASVTELEIRLARLSGVFCPRVCDAIREASYDPARTALRRDVFVMARALSDRRTREASQAMIARYNPTRPDGSPDVERVERLRRDLGRVEVPVLVLHGEHDETIPPEHGRRIAAALPRARFESVPRARHSPHGERPLWVAGAVLEFLEGVRSADGRAGTVHGVQLTECASP